MLHAAWSRKGRTGLPQRIYPLIFPPLENKIMPGKSWAAVERASRYIGGEFGSAAKDPNDVAIHMALAFPDLYEIGMSSTGYQILYQIANLRDDVFAERVFAPWDDYRAQLQSKNEPLHSLETQKPLSEFDLLLFSVQYELAATNIVMMLDLANIPRRAAERSEDMPLILAGGYGALNPEPWAPFFDALIPGDGEEVVGEILDALKGLKGAPRSEKLDAVSHIRGIYRPDQWEPVYEGMRFTGFNVAKGAKPAERRIVADLDALPDCATPVLPNTRPIFDRLAVEIMRGCVRGCRFCQPGFVNRPLRERSVKSIVDLIDKNVVRSGYDDLTLLSLSSADYSRLNDLLTQVRNIESGRRIAIAMPSLRVDAVSEDMIRQIASVRKTGFTIAPEAGTERLRRVCNKPITDEQIARACRTVVKHGWNLAKLYFMIGLPTETAEDREHIIEVGLMALRILDEGRRKGQVNVNIGTFVPKPHTPFAWEKQLSMGQADEIIRDLKAAARRTRIRIKAHDPGMSFVEGILTRGDRRVAAAIEKSVDLGGSFDGWTEHFDVRRWEQAFSEAGVDAERILAGYAYEDPTPWDGIDTLVDKGFLIEERKKAEQGALTEDCREGDCSACGVCDHEKILNILAREKPGVTDTSALGAPKSPPILFRYRVRYAKQGTLRYLGHLELASIIHRALRRAGFPLAYTQGFHPQPRVSFGPPLATGIESDNEYFDVFLTKHVEASKLLEDFRGQTLRDLPIASLEQVGVKDKPLFTAISAMTFEAFLGGLFDSGQADEQGILMRIEDFRVAESHAINIVKKSKTKSVEAKDIVSKIEYLGDGRVRMMLRFSVSGSLKPSVALGSILDIDKSLWPVIRWKKVETII